MVQFLESGKAKGQRDDLEYLAGLLVVEANRDYVTRNQSLPDFVPAVGVHGDESYTYVIKSDDLTLTIYNGAKYD